MNYLVKMPKKPNTTNMHATSNDIKKAFENMPDMFGVLDIEPEIKRISNTAPERQELYDLLDTLPIEKIRKVFQQLKTER